MRRNWTAGGRVCADKLLGVKLVDSEFEEYITIEIKKEITKMESLLKNDAPW